jgi:hypothetical protein
MSINANACDGHLGEPCGWTATNEGQGYTCQTVSWGTGCEPAGTVCPDGGAGSGGGSSSGTGSGSGASSSSSTSTGTPPAGLVFSPYKDTSINMNWNTDVIMTDVSGAATAIGTDLTANGGKAITLAFATGECGSENWAGVAGATMASANVSLLTSANVDYIVSTGGAAGSFTCSTDAGMEKFIESWASANLIGVDFDIEAGQSQSVISDLVARIETAHSNHAGLRFSLTLATLAVNNGSPTAESLGGGAQDSFNVYGDEAMAAVEQALGFTAGSPSTWPSYLTVDLMVMDYGSPSDGVCVVSNGECEMGQSAIQAAYNLHDKWGVPYASIELTPMIGGNDVSGETFTLGDADTIAAFAILQGLAGVHFWSYDRDVDCPPGAASATCNSYGVAGAHGFLKEFLAHGL